MSRLVTKPLSDGFRMPGEFEGHRGCIMIWPKRPGSWGRITLEAEKAFSEVAKAISESETVWMLADDDETENAAEFLGADIITGGAYDLKEKIQDAGSNGIYVIRVPSDDAWARDTGPTFVKNSGGLVRGINWKFNAWGGDVDGLYAHWDKDDKLASRFCEKLGYDYYDADPFVLEGGSVAGDGEGTVIVTEECLLSAGRNPDMSKSEIEEKLKSYLGAEKILWLPAGIYNDETNGHVDNICAFIKPGEVVLAWTDNRSDPQYERSAGCLEVLENETDAAGRHICVHKLPLPKYPVCVTQKDMENYVFEEGEAVRESGERLAASYVNFYISNKGVIIPQFGDDMDSTAVDILGELFPGRKMYPVPAKAILLGGGGIHCITQQVPL